MTDKERLKDMTEFLRKESVNRKVTVVTATQPKPLRDGAHIYRESAIPPPEVVIIDYPSLMKPGVRLYGNIVHPQLEEFDQRTF